MSFQALLFALILKWPPLWYPPGKNPETQEAYQVRVGTIAEAVAKEARAAKGWPGDVRSLAAATLVIWYGETRFDLEVHRGERGRWGSDNGRAKCMGQLHTSSLVEREEWERLGGTDLESTRRCARSTMRVLIASARYCKLHEHGMNATTLARAFAAYATGRGCKPGPQARARANSWIRAMRQI